MTLEEETQASFADAARRFVESEWATLGAVGWEKYQAVGRCALVVTWRVVLAYLEGDRSTYSVDVATPPPTFDPEDLLATALSDVLGAYDPAEQIAVLFVDVAAVGPPWTWPIPVGTRVALYPYRFDPSPPELYARRAN